MRIHSTFILQSGPNLQNALRLISDQKKKMFFSSSKRDLLEYFVLCLKGRRIIIFLWHRIVENTVDSTKGLCYKIFKLSFCFLIQIPKVLLSLYFRFHIPFLMLYSSFLQSVTKSIKMCSECFPKQSSVICPQRHQLNLCPARNIFEYLNYCPS